MTTGVNLDWSALLPDADIQERATTNSGGSGNALVSGEAIGTRNDATRTAPERFTKDDRRWCKDCQRLAGGVRCKAPAAGLLIASKMYEPVQSMPRRCVAYLPGNDDPDQTPGVVRWPWLIETK